MPKALCCSCNLCLRCLYGLYPYLFCVSNCLRVSAERSSAFHTRRGTIHFRVLRRPVERLFVPRAQNTIERLGCRLRSAPAAGRGAGQEFDLAKGTRILSFFDLFENLYFRKLGIGWDGSWLAGRSRQDTRCTQCHHT